MNTGKSLKDKLEAWKVEQHHIASQVLIQKDDYILDAGRSSNARFKIVSGAVKHGAFYGGVDVSFPETEPDQSVATYVILQDEKVVYQDFLYFNLTVPYVSSFLSFREIEPLEYLVKKQMEENPGLTPCAILVDGNGILHARRAGIACFLGVRTGIPTIGIGKTLYCEDGLEKESIRRGIDSAMMEVREALESLSDLPPEERPVLLHRLDLNSIEAPEEKYLERDTVLEAAALLCKGIGFKLKGSSGEVLCCALLGHGGAIGVKRRVKSGTKNPIYISIGHNISLDEAVAVCAELSQARIPEPVRQADLWGRELLRQKRNAVK
mmetsp:Transcript_6720/g.11111  ORF Transcript_6720/g.11111 Transcript_6720/m.11111 type:complete len:323 (+) Transcript_6720:72-1040(+)|eukprot:CAMPEP_0119014146 /NCGR_PEP_ID=MMETSP1176-20130426/9377_1 /TAXON_ID=265551 /ORGANISM="Synedropsis recta cf, Strain CCMP1620" /LENGTH=322 /DNA_ID=CAMNT_0006967287 /DNA_START=69 /DNA_END=1037 /DNA_ORIENTATION=-